MTTPESPRDGPAAGQVTAGAGARIRRPHVQRGGPIRGPQAPAADASQDPSINASVAQAVRLGYDVIAENIRQGREAAAKFRDGDYNIQDVPGDLETVLGRLIHLARDLSTTAFDVCERLLKEAVQPPPGPRPDTVPPFRSPGSPPPAQGQAANTPAGRLKLTVEFAGKGRAETRTEALDRPRRPTPAEAVSAGPLAPRGGGGGAISKVTFRTDISIEGLIAVVTLPPGLAAGVYSGLVYAENDPVPLGVLAIEVLK